MTSVQNLQLRLSGSNLCLVLLITFAISCTPSRVTTTSTDDRPTRSTVKVKDNRSGTYSDVDPDAPRDSIQVNQKNSDPVITDENYRPNAKTDFIKDVYRLAFIAPLESSQLDTANFETDRNMRFFHYYDGLKLASQVWAAKGLNVELVVFDSKETSVDRLVNSDELESFDLILGGYERSEIEALKKFAGKNELAYFSPWRTARSSGSNPYYVQLRPAILKQFEFISAHVAQNFSTDQVTIAIESGDENRLKPFQTYISAMKSTSSAKYKECVISDDTQHFEESDLSEYFQKSGPSVFILPYTSGSFFRTFLRKLKTDRADREIIVYGLHNWLENKTIDEDFYQALGIRLASWYYPQYDTEEWDAFVSEYYDSTERLPSKVDVIEGYDHMSYLGNMLSTYGTDLMSYNLQGEFKGISHFVDLQQILAVNNRNSTSESVDYLENGALRIVVLRDGEFVELD